jgi:hypothetical protein
MPEAQSLPPMRPMLAESPSQFVWMERAVESEYRPRLLQELQRRVEEFAKSTRAQAPDCAPCGRVMVCQDVRSVSWRARVGCLRVGVPRYRCPACKSECRPLLDLLGVEPGRISGSLARDLALLAAVVPYTLAARLADLLLGVKISSMGIWKVSQRLGQAVANYSEGLSRYHADSRSEGAATGEAPATVLLSVDGCALGMQVRNRRRRQTGKEPLPPLPPVEQGHFREVKTGVLLLPEERVETSPGRRSVMRRFLVSCLGDADAIFHRLYGQLRELGWLGSDTRVVIVGDGAEWIWNRATWFIRRCEILDFWHAMEHAWEFAHLRYGEGSRHADQWVRQIGIDLKAGRVEQVIARLKRLHPQSPQLRESLDSLIRYYSANATRMRYDEYLRLGYGIGSGSVESAHKQVVHARMRQAGMRWSEAGARRLLALRLLLLNGDWAVLDRLTMVSVG